MHIRDGILANEVCVATGLLAISAIGISVWRLQREPQRQPAAIIGAVAALIFAGQMVNFPLPGLPASGHLLGGVFAAALLGPWAGCLALSLVLLIQALVFGDGGLAALGANILNMAVVGCWGGQFILQRLQAVAGGSLSGRVLLAMLASVATVTLAAACFCVEFSLSHLSGSYDFSRLWAVMLTYHLLIGMGEALLTGVALAVWWSVARAEPGRMASAESVYNVPATRRVAISACLLACLIAASLSPWASELPDGLEAAGEEVPFNMLASDRVLLLPDYELPLPASLDGFSLPAAGLLGTLLTMLCGTICVAAIARDRAIPLRESL